MNVYVGKLRIDVSAQSPAMMNEIERAFQQPSAALLAYVAKHDNERVEGVAEPVRRIVALQATRNLGFQHPLENKLRRFEHEFNLRHKGIVWSHVESVSACFHDAIFLVHYWESQLGYDTKAVIKPGKWIRHVHDGGVHAEGHEWVLPNIFAPYLLEYWNGAECGSMWDQWIQQMSDAVAKLSASGKVRERATDTASTPTV